MTKKQKWMIGVSAAVLVALVIGAVFLWKGSTADPVEGTKTYSFRVVTAEGNILDFTMRTEKKYLADALVEAELIEYNEGGLYTTVAGITADYEKDGAYWLISCNGEALTVGMNDQPIADGDAYEATYTISK